MGRGKSLNHKKKSHPGDLPKGAEMRKAKPDSGEEAYLSEAEAFKNRVPEE
ncbi:hypothetical protein [Bacillus sp. FJAT-45350]|uniref:hypothetical protein n=1 Tax=Bacillus sp. FJAT-45350 TaxID=2011014 RepID=UPI0015CA19D4|nr:hypothetical protein [Bacillus sp. FJAT-45350]